MENWLSQLHASTPGFPPAITALKLAIAIGIGLLIGFERQWARKDYGVRTFSLTALFGALTTLISPEAMLAGMAAVTLLAVLLNVRDILVSRTVEGTTSVAILVTYILGVLIGSGHLFTSVACAIVTTGLLSLKPQFKQFAVGVRSEEIRSFLMLALFGFVIWPLLPDRAVDPWNLLHPREAWVTVVIVACIGFVNYVLLRLYGQRGVPLTAMLGGLVNSTATAAELATSLPAAGLVARVTQALLLTSVAMFLRNAVLLAIFARAGILYAAAPLLVMILVAAWFARHPRKTPEDATAQEARHVELHLSSPVSLRKVIVFGLLFLAIQAIGTLAVRWLGNSGVLVVSLIGGAVSSASATAAAANLASHGSISAAQAGAATVIASIASTAMNLPIVRRQIKDPAVRRQIFLATLLQTTAGLATLAAQFWLHH